MACVTQRQGFSYVLQKPYEQQRWKDLEPSLTETTRTRNTDRRRLGSAGPRNINYSNAGPTDLRLANLILGFHFREAIVPS